MIYGYEAILENDKLTWIDTPPPALLNGNVKVWIFLQDDFRKADNLPKESEDDLSLKNE